MKKNKFEIGKNAPIKKVVDNHKYQMEYMPIGMSIGMAVGLSLGYGVFDNITTGLSLGLCLGMCLGALIGNAKDKKVAVQLEEKGYKVVEINQIEAEMFVVKISDKEGNEQTIRVRKADLEFENFQVGDFIYLDEDGDIDNLMEDETYDR